MSRDPFDFYRPESLVQRVPHGCRVAVAILASSVEEAIADYEHGRSFRVEPADPHGLHPLTALAPAVEEKQKNLVEENHGHDIDETANGGRSGVNRVGNVSMLSTVVPTLAKPSSTVPAGAGCIDCSSGWSDMRPGDACPSCGGLLFGNDLACAIAHLRGNV